ncbi:MAG TPA: AI-2E family transporter [Micromonosporaceae bacterium]|nr:AI-2E family transporter [Micromonosporaceae bacterium]
MDAEREARPGGRALTGGDGAVWERVPWRVRLAALWSACLVLVAAGLYLIGVVAVRLAPLTLAVSAALFFTALLRPVYEGLRRIRLPASLASLGAVLMLLVAAVGPAVLVWRLTVGQFANLGERLAAGLERTRDLVTSGGSPISEEQVERLQAQVSGWGAGLLDGGEGARTVLEWVGALLLMVVLLFFVLKDGPGMWAWLLRNSAPRVRPALADAGSAAWDTITRYARGTLLIALIDGASIGLALLLLGVPLALPLALVTFVGAFVPIIGATVTGSAAVLVALAANGPVTALLTLAAVIAVEQLESNLLQPLIMKRQVRLHPAVVLVVVTAGTLAWGIAGAFLAVPIAAVLARIAAALRTRRDQPAGRPSRTGPDWSR